MWKRAPSSCLSSKSYVSVKSSDYVFVRKPNPAPHAKTLNQLRVDKYLDTSHFRFGYILILFYMYEYIYV